MSHTLMLLVTEATAIAATIEVVRRTRKPKFVQCADCPWSPDVAKRLHKKKVCDRHHEILKELRKAESDADTL